MPVAPLHPSEAKRLAAVQRTRMFGTPAEERFDKITRLAKRLFKVDLAIIDLAGEVANWLKSVQGLDLVDAPKDISYCQYAILEKGLCLITDALYDERVFDSPWASSIRFYAGVPIHFEGQPVGTLCVADAEPRQMNLEDFDVLKDLALLAEGELRVVGLTETQLELARENEELEKKALLDALTHTWNRGAIMEIAARELEMARTNKTPTGIVMFDIDHFKKINDTHGHPGGDEVLRALAARLRAAVRPTDAVGRFGGEEFMVVLPNTGPDGTLQAAERLRAAIADAPVRYGVLDIPVTVSLGCSNASTGNTFLGMLVNAADVALYEAKKNGRNKVVARWLTPSFIGRL